MRIDAGRATDVGKVRQQNEDRAVVARRRGGVIVAVADGVGGEHGGAIASEAAVTTLAEAYFRQRGVGVGRALAAAVGAANDAVLGAADAKALPGAATTLVAAAVRGKRVAVANLGDSRAYLLRRSALRQLTTDHSGMQARSITRFAGDPRGVQPDVFLEELKPGDRLLLCSDGVTTHLSDSELVPLLVSGSAADAAQRIVSAAVDRGGTDNATAVVVVVPPARPLLVRILAWILIALAAFAVVAEFFLLYAGD